MSKENSWILLIDDDPEFGKILESFLKRMDVRLERTESIKNFAEVIKKGLPAVCLVDLNINGLLAGFSLVTGLRKKYGTALPIIVISASNDQASISHAIECGADDYIVKPVDPQLFNAKVGRYIKLAKEVATEVTYTPAPAGGLAAGIGFEVSLKTLDELGVRAISPHFICKGAPTTFSGGVIGQIFPKKKKVLSTVNACELQADGSYLVSYEFAELTDDDKASLRAYLAAHK